MERSVPALPGLARVSGEGMGTAWVFLLYQGLEVDLQEFIPRLSHFPH